MPSLTSVDWTNIGHIAEFIGFILASLFTAFFQARRSEKDRHRDHDKTERDEDDEVQKETIDSFMLLVANYKEHIQELKDELAAANAAHERERRIMVHALLNASDTHGVFSATDLYDLRQIGVEIRERHDETQQHIERAQTIADDTAQALAEGGDSDDTGLA